jgi:hypothetical protein
LNNEYHETILAILSASPLVHETVLSVHYQREDGTMVFRYDNAPHFPHLPTAPNHKHVEETEVIAAEAPDLESVLKEIEGLIKT